MLSEQAFGILLYDRVTPLAGAIPYTKTGKREGIGHAGLNNAQSTAQMQGCENPD